MTEEKISDRIKWLLDKESLRGLCDRANLNYEAAKKWKKRGTVPDGEALMKIGRSFRADLHWLITGENVSSRLDQNISRRIKQLRKKNGWPREELAHKLKMKSKIWGRYEDGKWPLSPDLKDDILKCFGIQPQTLVLEGTGPSAQIPDLKIMPSSATSENAGISAEDYVSIPLTDSAIAAGEPIIQNENIEDYVLLHIRAAGKRNNLVASRVDGDSMEPMLHSGDIVVIDRDDKKIVKNKIFAIFYENGLTAKYVETQKNVLILRPVNPLAQVQIINLAEHPDPIVGRIIGAWKTF